MEDLCEPAVGLDCAQRRTASPALARDGLLPRTCRRLDGRLLGHRSVSQASSDSGNPRLSRKACEDPASWGLPWKHSRTHGQTQGLRFSTGCSTTRRSSRPRRSTSRLRWTRIAARRRVVRAFALARFVCPASRLQELPASDRALSVVARRAVRGDARVEAVEAQYREDLGSLAGLAPEIYVEVPLDAELEDRLDEIADARPRGEDPLRRRDDSERRGARRVRPLLPGARPRVQGDCRLAPPASDRRGARVPQPARRRRVRATRSGARGGGAGRVPVRREGFGWRGRIAGYDEVARVRRERLRSIGSCSFFEPVDALAGLGALPRERGGRVRGLLGRGWRPSRRLPGRGRRARPRRGGARLGVRGVFAEPVSGARPGGLGGHDRARRAARHRRARSSCRSPASPRTFPSRSATTSTSTRRSSTRRTSAASSGRIPSRCSRTGDTSRSATTDAPAPSSSAGRRSCGRAGRRRRRTSRLRRYGPSRRLDIELELGFVVGVGSRSVSRSQRARSATTSSASCSSTTGAHATSRPGSTSRSAPSSASRSPRRSRPGSRRWRCSRIASCHRLHRIRSRFPTCASTATGPRRRARGRARRRRRVAEERERPVLDDAAAARARDRERRVDPHGRPLRLRDDLGAGSRAPRARSSS